MTSGNVVCGTLWNNVSGTDNIQQVLATSNGGRIFPVYESNEIDISLKTNLNQNLYNFQGYLDTDTNPFVFVALTQQTNNITPGYFMVSYQYEFKNPLGEGFDYSTLTTTAGDITKEDVWETTTAVLLSTTTVAAIGTKLVVKVVDDAIQFFLGGSRVGVLADAIFKLFRSTPRKSTKQNQEYQDLVDAYKITACNITLEQTINGSAVNTMITLDPTPGMLKLENLLKFSELMNGADYTAVGGLFFDLVQVGTGRYNIRLYSVSNCTQRVPDNFYVLKVPHGGNLVDYGCCTQSTPLVIGLNECRCEGVALHLEYDEYAPLQSTIPTFSSFDDATPVVVANVALQTIEQAFGVGGNKVVGTGSTILVPTVEWRLSNKM